MKWHLRFLEMAKLVASWSRDPSTKVGAVLAEDNHHVVSVGFNGFPASMPDNEVWYNNREEKYSRIIHAEVNALLFAPTPLPETATLYTYPFIPCDRCIVQMLQAGIKTFVAPTPTEDAIGRWGGAFYKTRQYVHECGGILLEVDFR